jgi:hypothetical protein
LAGPGPGLWFGRWPGLTLRLGVALLLAVSPALAGERLAEADIAQTFSGMTLDGIYAEGEFFSETYKDDGTIRYHGSEGADTGEWSVQNGKFCTFYEGQQGACFFVEKDGANCYSFFAEADGSDGRLPEVKWTSRGWDRSLPSTCPTAPEVEL